ncbi:hypothetical protein LTR53_000240 [Teratosphaeriaceae sp. CCFEE 6253]|nr:hypothetical protein LTR53_000240 [Teratosphaeriaceae sp. CCFEE 6253]
MPENSNIRCFNLLPGAWDDGLRGKLFTQPYDRNAPYEAISYTWGREQARVGIICDEGGMDVGHNLAVLLRRLRSPTNTTCLWVDAICINQADTDEQSRQVRRIQAARVTIWLGEEDETTADAFDLLEALHTVVLMFDASAPEPSSFEHLATCGLPSHLDSRWYALWSLLSHPWFSRTWVLQEASTNKITWVQRGGYIFEWARLVHILLRIYTARVDILYNIDFSASAQMIAFCWSIHQNSWGVPLDELLQTSLWTSSSKAVDKVFGLIGLASDREELKRLVDYTYEAADVYRRVALKYLLKGEMKILHMAADHSFGGFTNLPSWVPDLTGNFRAGPLYQELVLRGYQWLPPRRLPRVSQDHTTLDLSGRLTDRVAAIGRRLPLTRVSDRAIALIFFESWRRLAHKAGKAVLNEDIDTSFACLLAIEDPLGQCASAKYKETYFRFLAKSPIHAGIMGSAPSLDSEQVDALRFRDRVSRMCRKRTFFVTQRGYLGLGPYFMRPGDRVVHFDGAMTPFIVRSARRGRYKLVGEAYVRGWTREERTDFDDICLV